MHPTKAGIAAVLRAAYGEWNRDNGMMLAAAVAFYATFSLAPILVLLLNATAYLFGEQAARERLLALTVEVAGPRAAAAVERLLAAASNTDAGATALSVVVLIVAASAVFRHLKLAMNIVLDVPTKEDGGVLLYLHNRLLAAVIAVVGIVLLIAAISATAAIQWIGVNIPAAIDATGLWRLVELLVLFIVLSIGFGAALRFVPDVNLEWRHVSTAAVLAALLFMAGQQLIAFYVAHSNITTAYGAAGSIVLLLVYIYFTAAVLLAAAEVTEVYARHDAEFRRDRRKAQDEQPYAPRKESSPAA